MASTPTYPGVYIRELTSPVHTIAGVATSIAAFVGYTAKGIDNRAEHIFDFSDFERYFGGLASDSELSYAVQQFFSNGGTEAYVVRTPRTGATGAQVVFNSITFTALSSGSWADGQLLLDVDYTGIDHTVDATAFNLTITDLQDGTTEFFPQLSLKNTQSNYITAIVNDPDNGSQLVKASVTGSPSGAPVVTGIVGATITNTTVNTALGGGTAVATGDFGVKISVSSPTTAPAPLPITVKVFSSGSPLPQSLAGLAAQLQTTVNNALAIQMPGASIQASVAPTATGSGIRVNALLPQAPDAVVTIVAPTTGPGDAAGPLGLAAPFSVNVAHYAMGTGNGTSTNSWGGSQTRLQPETLVQVSQQPEISLATPAASRESTHCKKSISSTCSRFQTPLAQTQAIRTRSTRPSTLTLSTAQP